MRAAECLVDTFRKGGGGFHGVLAPMRGAAAPELYSTVFVYGFLTVDLDLVLESVSGLDLSQDGQR